MPTYHTIAGFPKSVSPSSHASEANGFVFLTGQFGRDLEHPSDPLPEGIKAQTARTLENVALALKHLGLSMSDVLSVRAFLTHFDRDYDAMNEVYAEHFPLEDRPTRTCVGVTSLVRGALIEIDCVAFRPTAPERA